jgi:hypothetical protein
MMCSLWPFASALLVVVEFLNLWTGQAAVALVAVRVDPAEEAAEAEVAAFAFGTIRSVEVREHCQESLGLGESEVLGRIQLLSASAGDSL